MIILIVSVVVAIASQVIVKAKIGTDEGANMVAMGATDLMLGRIWYEAARINMEFDRYTWIGKLTGHEMFYYCMLYGGLIIAIAGVVTIIAGFYWKISKNTDKDEGNVKIVRKVPEKKEEPLVQATTSYTATSKIPAWKQVEIENTNK